MKTILSDEKVQLELFDICARHIGVVVDTSNNTPIGTGVFIKIDEQGFFVTAKHVVIPDFFCKKLKISFNFSESNGEKGLFLNFDSFYSEINHDLVFFNINPSIDIQYFDNSVNSYNKTNNALVWGCPTDLTEKNGEKRRFRLINLWVSDIQYGDMLELSVNYEFDANNDQLKSLGGFSGGPIFNEKGEFLGVTKNQVYSKENKIEKLNGIFFNKTNLSKYSHLNLRTQSENEIPYLIRVTFELVRETGRIELFYEGILGLKKNEDDEYIDCWLSFNHIGRVQDQDQRKEILNRTIDHSEPLLLHLNEDYEHTEELIMIFTELGKEKFKTQAIEMIHLMLFGGLRPSAIVKCKDFICGILDTDRYENHKASFQLFPPRIPPVLK